MKLGVGGKLGGKELGKGKGAGVMSGTPDIVIDLDGGGQLSVDSGSLFLTPEDLADPTQMAIFTHLRAFLTRWFSDLEKVPSAEEIKALSSVSRNLPDMLAVCEEAGREDLAAAVREMIEHIDAIIGRSPAAPSSKNPVEQIRGLVRSLSKWLKEPAFGPKKK